MTQEPDASPPQRALRALSGIVGALALAEALGAPAGPLTTALERLVGATARLRGLALELPPLRRRPPPREPRRRARAPRASRGDRQVRQQVQEEVSAWDPETPYERMEVGRCRALLLEIVRRAIHDWILYRNHSDIVMRRRAESAFVWLFEEEPGHAWWREREHEGHTITSFLAICDALDLDPNYVRDRARKTTVKQIMTSGRPAEHRRPNHEVSYEEHAVDEDNVKVSSLDALDQPRGGFTTEMEAYFASYTPDYD